MRWGDVNDPEWLAIAYPIALAKAARRERANRVGPPKVETPIGGGAINSSLNAVPPQPDPPPLSHKIAFHRWV